MWVLTAGLCVCVCVCVEGCCARVLGESIAVDVARPQTVSNALSFKNGHSRSLLELSQPTPFLALRSRVFRGEADVQWEAEHHGQECGRGPQGALGSSLRWVNS